jgi:hypothetical protein
MEDRAMKNTRTLTLTGIAMLLGLGLVLSGCGLNRAQDRADAGTVPSDQETVDLPDDFGVELTARERDLLQRERELDRREDRLADRIADLEDRIDEDADAPQSDPAPVPVDRTATLTLPASTTLVVEIDNELSSETSLAGDAVTALVLDDLVVDGLVAIPAGSTVLGFVGEVVPQRKLGGQARLTVDFDTLALTTGERLPIQAALVAEGKPQKKKDAATIGGAAAGGAILGRILKDDDKTEGTLIGAAVGAAIGTAVASRNAGDPVIVAAGSTVDLVLAAPVVITIVL